MERITKKSIGVLLSLLFCLSLSIQSKAISTEESSWLRNLYISTNGSEWDNKAGWSEAGAGCNSFGVTCTGAGVSEHVVALALTSNNLSGNLPQANIYSNLRYLSSLKLQGNKLTGSIPIGFVYFISLTELDLNNNLLNGNIPITLSLLPLKYLDLSNNQLTESIPPSFGNLRSLENLYLDHNQLSGNIPAELGDLSNLVYLSLGNNQLNGTIPAELGNLPNLKYLVLVYNQLNGSIPSELGNLVNLQYLILQINQLTGTIPPVLGNLPNLRSLSLYGNQLNGSIPSELGNLINLTHLALSGNQLNGSIPPELGKLINLQYLAIYSNRLTESIPPELGNLTNLQQLYLNNNQLNGTIPSELGKLINLQHFSLNNNQLNGSIPSELGNLTNLQDLRLQVNQMNGSIPSELGNMTNLQLLDLQSNQLTGSIPSALGNLINLYRLSLNVNQLTGRIPVTLMNLTNLINLQICDNHLYNTNPELQDFLEKYDPDWEDCQTPPFHKPMPWLPLLLHDEAQPEAPLIALSQTSLNFFATEGSGSPSTQTISVTNSGSDTLSGLDKYITYGSGQPTGWLAAALSSDTAPATLSLNPITGSLSAGTYTATVSLISPVANNSPQNISVTFTVAPLPIGPILNVPMVSSDQITLTWTFSWPGSVQYSSDCYLLEESTSSSNSGFSLTGTYYSHTSPYTVSLTRGQGTYFYRVRARYLVAGMTKYTAYSEVRSAIIAPSSGPSSLKIINNLYSGVEGTYPNQIDWGNLNTVLTLRVGPTWDSVNTGSGAYELLQASDSVPDPEYAYAIAPGYQQTFDVSQYGFGSEYYVLIGLGWWEPFCSPPNYNICYWTKHFSSVVSCAGDVVYGNKWTVVHVFPPFGSPEEIRTGDFFPAKHWYGTSYCQ